MSMNKWEGIQHVVRVCLCLFYEQALNITASGTLDGCQVERNKDEEGMQARQSDGEGKEDGKEENLMGRRFLCLPSKSPASTIPLMKYRHQQSVWV